MSDTPKTKLMLGVRNKGQQVRGAVDGGKSRQKKKTSAEDPAGKSRGLQSADVGNVLPRVMRLQKTPRAVREPAKSSKMRPVVAAAAFLPSVPVDLARPPRLDVVVKSKVRDDGGGVVGAKKPEQPRRKRKTISTGPAKSKETGGENAAAAKRPRSVKRSSRKEKSAVKGSAAKPRTVKKKPSTAAIVGEAKEAVPVKPVATATAAIGVVMEVKKVTTMPPALKRTPKSTSKPTAKTGKPVKTAAAAAAVATAEQQPATTAKKSTKVKRVLKIKRKSQLNGKTVKTDDSTAEKNEPLVDRIVAPPSPAPIML